MSAPDLTLERDGARAALWFAGPPWRGGRAAAIDLACAEADTGTALLDEALAALARRGGASGILAPMAGDTWHSYRLAIEGMADRPPFLLEPPEAPAARAALRARGFVAVASYASTLLDLSQPTGGLGGARGVRLRPFDTSRAEEDLALIHDLSSRAFTTAPFFSPIDRDTFLSMYRTLVPRLLPDLAPIAEAPDGTPLGFLFGLPDWSQGASPSTVILKSYAALRPGIGGILANAFHARARAMGFREAIHALMHEDNLSLRHSLRLGARIFRRYALFGRDLP